MRRTLTKTDIKLSNLGNDLKINYKTIIQTNKDFEKEYKREYKKIVKSISKNIENHFLDNELDMGVVEKIIKITFNLTDNVLLMGLLFNNIEDLKKDKNLIIFIKNILVYNSILRDYCDTKTLKENIELLKYYFGNPYKLVVSYFLITETNINETKMLNVMSYLFKNSIISLSPRDMTEENKEKIRMINTGIKYEKERQSVNNINYEREQKRKKSNKFDFLQYLSTRITIKYLSKRDYNLRFHKRPIEHIRKGHYRHYKNGSVVWVSDSIVNEGLVS